MFFYILVVCKGVAQETLFVEVTIQNVCYVLIVLADEQQLLVAIKTFKPDSFLLDEGLEVEDGIPLALYLARQVGFDHIPILTFENICSGIETKLTADFQEDCYTQIPNAEILLKIAEVLFLCIRNYSIPIFAVTIVNSGM